VNPKIDIVIPTKSNFDDLFKLVEQLQADNSVENIVIVCDGTKAFKYVGSRVSAKMKVFYVDLSVGIHKMWNVGINYLSENGSTSRGNHIAFINDDISLGENAMTRICEFLEDRKDVGLVTPSWKENIKDEFVENTRFGGFCMCVRSDLISEWRFDESMKWWYGDNDIISWVSYEKNMKVGITGKAKCSGNRSYTIKNDPPPNFKSLIENDSLIYHEKWDKKIASINAERGI
jgi:hypothetical protein